MAPSLFRGQVAQIPEPNSITDLDSFGFQLSPMDISDGSQSPNSITSLNSFEIDDSPYYGSFDRSNSVALPMTRHAGPATPPVSTSIQSNYLFNIERDGDPKISPFMYYDFIVSKTEAYYILQPGYLPTEKYPSRIKSEKIIMNGESRHPCKVQDCKAKPFTRHYDLERHFKTFHQGGKQKSDEEQCSGERINKDQGEKIHIKCDYKKCDRPAFSRKDHCREHYRQFHTEDLIKRGQSKGNKETAEMTEEFPASRIKTLHLGWWRCTKCIERVPIGPNGYMCPTCKLTCEPERVTRRENERKQRDKGLNSANNVSNFSSAQMDYVVTNCSQCENAWIPDEIDESLWISCPRCQPGVSVTRRV